MIKYCIKSNIPSVFQKSTNSVIDRIAFDQTDSTDVTRRHTTERRTRRMMMRAVVRAATRRATTSATAAAVVRPTSAVWQKSYAVRVMTMTMTIDEAWTCMRHNRRLTTHARGGWMRPFLFNFGT